MQKINTKFTFLFLILVNVQNIFTMQREIEQSGIEQNLEFADLSVNSSNIIPQVQAQTRMYDTQGLAERLLNAARDGRVEDLCELLQDPKVDIKNAKDKKGNTALHLAVREGHIESVRVLLQDPRTDVNAKDNNDNTVLIKAVSYRDVEIVRELLKDSRIKVNAKNNNGSTALHLAAWNGHIKNVHELLQDPRTDVNASDNKGDTALHMVACNGYQVNIARELLKDERIEVNAKNKDGNTALDFADRARSVGHPDVFNLLKGEPKELKEEGSGCTIQ